MFNKKCEHCGEWTYSASSNIWKCITCGKKIDDEKAWPSEIDVKDCVECGALFEDYSGNDFVTNVLLI